MTLRLTKIFTVFIIGSFFSLIISSCNLIPSISEYNIMSHNLKVYKLTPDYVDFYDYFGRSVSVSSDGNTIATGAAGQSYSYDTGALYIYKWDGQSWNETKLEASDYPISMGETVSISSDSSTVVAGAPWDNENGRDSGSIYVFKWDGYSWQDTRLNPSDGSSYDSFGMSVSVSSDGNTIVSGALSDDRPGYGNGSLYVFKWNGFSWNETKLMSSYYDDFGESVSISSNGNTIVAGASSDDENGYAAGAIHVFSWNGSSWSQMKLIATDSSNNNDHLGNAVSISSDGNIIVSGASGDNTYTGSIYIFKRNGSSWSQTKLRASDGSNYDYFGSSVSISSDGNTIVTSATGDYEMDSHSGSIYIYKWNGIDWDEIKLNASDLSNSHFGFSVSVSLDGNTIVSGSDGRDSNNSPGAVYVYKF